MASGGADADEELYALDVATNTFTQLTDDDIRQLFATWSPDGRQIAYSNDYVLWMMEANGSNKHQVTQTRHATWTGRLMVNKSSLNGRPIRMPPATTSICGS